MNEIVKNHNGGSISSILPPRDSGTSLYRRSIRDMKQHIRKMFDNTTPPEAVHMINPYKQWPADELARTFEKEFTKFNNIININYSDSINKVKVYLIFTYFFKDNIFHPILAISDTDTGIIDQENDCYQLLGQLKKTAQPQNSIRSKKSKIKAVIEKMKCKKIHDYNTQMENLQTNLTIKAFVYIGYFTPSFHHNNSKSSSNIRTKPILTRTQRLFKNSIYQSNNKTDNHNISSSASVKKFIEHIEKGKFNNDNYSLKNNNCQTFCKNALDYLKKITSNNEFFSPTYTFGKDKILHMVDIRLIQSHKAIRTAIDKINSTLLLASDVGASIKSSKKSLKPKPISEEITDIKAKGIRKSTIRRQNQLRQIQQTRRKHNRKHKNKKSTSRKHKNQNKNQYKNFKKKKSRSKRGKSLNHSHQSTVYVGGQPSPHLIRLGIVTTTKHAVHLKWWIEYHLHIGFDFIFIYFDAPDEDQENFTMASQIDNNRVLCLKGNQDANINNIIDRQTSNVSDAIVRCKKFLYADWLLHIDDDELFYPLYPNLIQQWKRYDIHIQSNSKPVPNIVSMYQKTQFFKIQNIEVQKTTHPLSSNYNFFQHEHFFKKNLNNFLSYANCKSMGNVWANGIQPFGVHRFKSLTTTYSPLCQHAFILHFPFSHYNKWRNKFKFYTHLDEAWEELPFYMHCNRLFYQNKTLIKKNYNTHNNENIDDDQLKHVIKKIDDENEQLCIDFYLETIFKSLDECKNNNEDFICLPSLHTSSAVDCNEINNLKEPVLNIETVTM